MAPVALRNLLRSAALAMVLAFVAPAVDAQQAADCSADGPGVSPRSWVPPQNISSTNARSSVTGGLDFARLLSEVGNAALAHGDPVAAANYQRRALAIRQKLAPRSLLVAETLGALGNAALDQGKVANAEDDWNRSLTIRQAISPGSREVALSLIGLGSVARRRGDMVGEESFYEQALQLRTVLQPPDLADIYDGLGSACAQRICAQSPESYFRAALQLRQQFQPDSLELANTLSFLGRYANNDGDLQEAERDYAQALELRRRLAPGSMAVAQSLTDLGVLARARGDLATAELCLRQGLRIRQHWAPDTLAIADSLHNIGIVYWLRDDLQGAQRFLQPTLSLRRRLAPDSPQLAQSLIWQGLVEIRSDKLSAAERHFGQALQLLEKTSSSDSLAVASVLSNLGSVSRTRGELAVSQEYYRKALDIQSRRAPDSPAEANTLQALAGLIRQHGDLEGAEGYYRRALHILEQKTPNSSARAGTLFALASLLRQEKKKEDAEPLFAQAVAVLERQTDVLGGSPEDRSVFRARYENSYREYADLLVSLGRTEESLRILERARARGLLEMLSGARVTVPGHPETTQVHAALTEPPTLSTPQIQDLLDDNTLLLEYSLAPGASGHVWAVTHTTVSVYGLPSRKIVEQAALQVRELLTARAHRPEETDAQRHRRLRLADARYLTAAQQLSNLVLGPVAPLLENRRIVVVPDGPLQYIPFAALPAPSGHTPLVMQHEVVNLPSASVLAELRQQAQRRMLAPKAVVVLADPVFDKQDERIERSVATESAAYIDRLPWTRLEAAEILKVTPPGEGMQVLDFDASRATALSSLLSKYRIVHFATHAISDGEHPDKSGLVLSLFDRHGLAQNGFLGLEQIYGLNLSADLVVLSACETALGREVDGEGLIGLVHGFMYAGATRVMASLWSVDDEVTAELMAHFYRNLELNASSPAAALRAAQIEVSKQARWSSPYYWAAFQLQGEWLSPQDHSGWVRPLDVVRQERKSDERG